MSPRKGRATSALDPVWRRGIGRGDRFWLLLLLTAPKVLAEKINLCQTCLHASINNECQHQNEQGLPSLTREEIGLSSLEQEAISCMSGVSPSALYPCCDSEHAADQPCPSLQQEPCLHAISERRSPLSLAEGFCVRASAVYPSQCHPARPLLGALRGTREL